MSRYSVQVVHTLEDSEAPLQDDRDRPSGLATMRYKDYHQENNDGNGGSKEGYISTPSLQEKRPKDQVYGGDLNNPRDQIFRGSFHHQLLSSHTIFNALSQGGESEDECLSMRQSEGISEGLEERNPLVTNLSGNSKYKKIDFNQEDQPDSDVQRHSVTSFGQPHQHFPPVIKQLQNGRHANSLKELHAKVMSRSEWLSLLRQGYERLQEQQVIEVNREILLMMIQQILDHLPLKEKEEYLVKSKERCLSLGQVIGAINAWKDQQFDWDDFMDEILSLKSGYPDNQRDKNENRKKPKVTVLKDRSLLVDCSLIQDFTFTFQQLIDENIEKDELGKMRALSLCETKLKKPYYLPSEIQSSLVILNLSGSNILFDEISTDFYFPQLQFLNLSASSLTSIPIELSNDKSFPSLKELLLSDNPFTPKFNQPPLRFPATLRLLDLANCHLTHFDQLKALLSPHLGLLVLNLQGNPLQPFSVLTLKTWFPKASLFSSDCDEISSASCFENFQALAFKKATVKVVKRSHEDEVTTGGVTLSPEMLQTSPTTMRSTTPTARIDLKAIMSRPFEVVESMDSLQEKKEDKVLGGSFKVQEQMRNFVVKNDSLKYFNHYSKEGDYIQYAQSQKEQTENPGTPRTLKLLDMLHSKQRPQSALSVQDYVRIPSIRITNQNSVRSTRKDSIASSGHPYLQPGQSQPVKTSFTQMTPPFKQAYPSLDQQTSQPLQSHIVNRETPFRQNHQQQQLLVNESSNQNSEMAAYYEQQISLMNLDLVKTMSSKQVCVIDCGGSKRITPGRGSQPRSPIKAMMITKPPPIVAKNQSMESQRIIKLLKVSEAQPSIHQKFQNKGTREEQKIASREIKDSLDFAFGNASHSKTRNALKELNPKQTMPEQSQDSLVAYTRQGGASSPSKTMISTSSIGTESRKSAPDRFGYLKHRGSSSMELHNKHNSPQQKVYAVQRVKELTFNNNTNTSNQNSARNGAGIGGIYNKTTANERVGNIAYLDNSGTPRFSERMLGLSSSNSIGIYGQHHSKEDTYADAMMLIKAQRIKNEKKKALVNGKMSGSLPRKTNQQHFQNSSSNAYLSKSNGLRNTTTSSSTVGSFLRGSISLKIDLRKKTQQS